MHIVSVHRYSYFYFVVLYDTGDKEIVLKTDKSVTDFLKTNPLRDKL